MDQKYQKFCCWNVPVSLPQASRSFTGVEHISKRKITLSRIGSLGELLGAPPIGGNALTHKRFSVQRSEHLRTALQWTTNFQIYRENMPGLTLVSRSMQNYQRSPGILEIRKNLEEYKITQSDVRRSIENSCRNCTLLHPIWFLWHCALSAEVLAEHSWYWPICHF